jgi:hypothetical protein
MINEAHQGLYAYALETIRSLILLNGGAIIAILTFAGHLVASDSSATSILGVALAKLLLGPMALFVFGAVSAVATAGFSYMSQSNFLLWHDTEEDCYLKFNACWRNGAIVAAWSSIFSFGGAGLLTLWILGNAALVA